MQPNAGAVVNIAIDLDPERGRPVMNVKTSACGVPVKVEHYTASGRPLTAREYLGGTDKPAREYQ